MALSLVNGNTFNAYTGSLPDHRVRAACGAGSRTESAAVRNIPFPRTMVVGVVVAILGYQSFVTNLSNFLDDLLLLFIPWSAVNITDYFAVRHGRYDVAAFYDPSGGPYGKVAWRGIAAVLAGFAAEWPFTSQPDYTGPLVAHLGGADISWVTGWIVAAGVYLLLASRTSQPSRPGRPAAAPVG